MRQKHPHRITSVCLASLTAANIAHFSQVSTFFWPCSVLVTLPSVLGRKFEQG